MIQSLNVSAHSIGSGVSSIHQSNALLMSELAPDLVLERVGNQAFIIAPKHTGCGDYVGRLIFKQVNDDRKAYGALPVFFTDRWTINLTNEGIDLDLKLGGRVDGSTLLANRDYIIWAFADLTQPPEQAFKGFGLTYKPDVVDAAITGGTGDLGDIGEVTVSSTYGNIFVKGARVIARVGINANDAYNQGIITDINGDVLTIAWDTDYGFQSGNNGDLPVAPSTLQILQVNRFEPRTFSGGIYGNYSWLYIGSVNTTSASHIRSLRLRGEPWTLPQPVTCAMETSTGAPVVRTTGWGRAVRAGAQYILIYNTITLVDALNRVAATGTALVSAITGGAPQFINQAESISTISATGISELGANAGSVTFTRASDADEATAIYMANGFIDREW